MDRSEYKAALAAKDARIRELEEAKKDLAEREFQRGFREGESKQALLEIQGLDKFLADVKLRQEDIYEYRMKLRTAESRFSALEKVLSKVRSLNGTWCGAKRGIFHFEPSEEEKKPCGKCALCVIDAALDAAKEPQLPCPHGRPPWKQCPHCLSVNEAAKEGK